MTTIPVQEENLADFIRKTVPEAATPTPVRAKKPEGLLARMGWHRPRHTDTSPYMSTIAYWPGYTEAQSRARDAAFKAAHPNQKPGEPLFAPLSETKTRRKKTPTHKSATLDPKAFAEKRRVEYSAAKAKGEVTLGTTIAYHAEQLTLLAVRGWQFMNKPLFEKQQPVAKTSSSRSKARSTDDDLVVAKYFGREMSQNEVSTPAAQPISQPTAATPTARTTPYIDVQKRQDRIKAVLETYDAINGNVAEADKLKAIEHMVGVSSATAARYVKQRELSGTLDGQLTRAQKINAVLNAYRTLATQTHDQKKLMKEIESVTGVIASTAAKYVREHRFINTLYDNVAPERKIVGYTGKQDEIAKVAYLAGLSKQAVRLHIGYETSHDQQKQTIEAVTHVPAHVLGIAHLPSNHGTTYMPRTIRPSVTPVSTVFKKPDSSA